MKVSKKISLVFIFFIIFIGTVFGTFTVAPMRIEFQVDKNNSGNSSITVNNTGEKPVSVKIYVKDFKREPNGIESERDIGSIPRSCSNWISVSPKTMDLEPGERKNVKITIIVPENVEGSYWSMIYVEQTSKPIPKKREGLGYSFEVGVKARWAIRVIENIPGVYEKSAEITNVTVSDLEKDTLFILNTQIENFGKTIIKCNGWIEIRDEFGETIDKIEMNNFTVYPDGKRIIKTDIPTILKPGEYSALVVIDYEAEFLIAGEVFFEIPEKKSE